MEKINNMTLTLSTGILSFQGVSGLDCTHLGDVTDYRTEMVKYIGYRFTSGQWKDRTLTLSTEVGDVL